MVYDASCISLYIYIPTLRYIKRGREKLAGIKPNKLSLLFDTKTFHKSLLHEGKAVAPSQYFQNACQKKKKKKKKKHLDQSMEELRHLEIETTK